MPSKSIASCAAVTLTLPSLAAGQTKRPRSSRLENRQAPWLSHQMIFSRSPRRPRNTNKWPQNGSAASVFSAWAESVLNPRRISVTPAANHTRVFEGTGIKTPIPSAGGQVHRRQTLPQPSAGGHWPVQSRYGYRRAVRGGCRAMAVPGSYLW